MIKILKNFIYVLTTLFIVVTVIFSFKNNSSPIKEIVVNSENKFLDRYQIENLIIEKMGKDSIIKNADIIEKNILANPFVKEIKLYQDLSNKLIVDLVQYQPIARLVSENKKDFYIDLHGNIFPTSTKFSERVLLIHTADNINFDLKNINSTDYGKKIFTMINYIINDTFLSKIISSVFSSFPFKIRRAPFLHTYSSSFNVLIFSCRCFTSAAHLLALDIAYSLRLVLSAASIVSGILLISVSKSAF